MKLDYGMGHAGTSSTSVIFKAANVEKNSTISKWREEKPENVYKNSEFMDDEIYPPDYQIIPNYSPLYFCMLLIMILMGICIGSIMGLLHWRSMEVTKDEILKTTSGINCLMTPNSSLFYKSWCDQSLEDHLLQDQKKVKCTLHKGVIQLEFQPYQ